MPGYGRTALMMAQIPLISRANVGLHVVGFLLQIFLLRMIWALAVVGGALVEAGVRLFVNAFAFRLVEMGAANFILETLFSNFGTYPLSIYTAAVRIALTVVVPVAFVAYVPAAVLLARTGELQLHPLLADGAPLVGVVLFALADRFWRGQLRHYQSAGH